ncbi:MAG: NAD(P)-binding domain-containing protein, partial [Chloroflexota bacterium]
MKVGFIGLGNMGGAVARNIQRAGFDLTVHDIRKDAAKKLIEHGASWANTPADIINQVDVVVTMVFGPKQIEQVVRGEHGLLSGNCQHKGWIDSTTSGPVLMRELAAAFEQAGGLPVDAPVTGSVDAAIRGDMIMFVGGTEAAIAQ